MGLLVMSRKNPNLYLTFQGQTKRMKDWAIEKGIKLKTLSLRINKGWSVEDALTTKVRKLNQNLSGMRFGRLIVVKYLGRKYDGHYNWLCRCDCENQTKEITI